jgi:hypothetical protein
LSRWDCVDDFQFGSSLDRTYATVCFTEAKNAVRVSAQN